MARDPYSYRELLVHVTPDPASGRLQVRPLPGQAFATTLRVQCSRRLKEQYPAGTVFKVNARMTDRLGGEPFLYVWPGDQAVVMPPGQVEAYLQAYRRVRI